MKRTKMNPVVHLFINVSRSMRGYRKIRISKFMTSAGAPCLSLKLYRKLDFAQVGICASDFLKKYFHCFLNGPDSDQFNALHSPHLLLILFRQKASFKSQPGCLLRSHLRLAHPSHLATQPYFSKDRLSLDQSIDL